MNFKSIRNHFPELAQLPVEQQQALLAHAEQTLNQAASPLTKVRDKLLDLALIVGLCLLLIKIIAPALGLAPQTSAIVVMLVVLPCYLLLQQRRYIAQLRRHLPPLP